MSSAEEKARVSRAHNFDRRQKAALEGIHLPSIEELLRSMSFLRGQLSADAAEFAHRAKLRLQNIDKEADGLSQALSLLQQQPDVDQFMLVRHVLSQQAPRKRLPSLFLESGKKRCDFYAACLGDIRSMGRVALYAMNLARSSRTPPDEAFDYAMSAIGWTSLASYIGRGPYDDHQRVHVHGSTIFDELSKERDRGLTTPDTADARDTNSTPSDGVTEDSKVDFSDSIVILDSMAESDNRGKAIQREFQNVIGTRLPLCKLPALSSVRTQLHSEFPHAATLVDQLLSRLASESVIKFRPLLFIGAPGSGKTTFARRFLQALGVQTDVYPCGGVDDASLMGTPRRWMSGEASMPVLMMRRFGTASPGIILDELDKVSSGRQNGALHDCLHGLLEHQTSSAWRDPYLQVPVDLSHVLWVATANSTERIPRTLVDRLTCFSFPLPDKQHLWSLANNMIKDAFQKHGLDVRWATQLDSEELAALEAAWPGGSLRALQRLVEVVLDARSAWSRRH